MRLNCNIRPEQLSDEHLFAEQRELKMLPSLYKRIGDGSRHKSPDKFTLGKGHILFFIYKPNYTHNRYNLVFDECIRRGYNITNESWRWTDAYGDQFLGKPDYEETGVEKYILIDRITSKVMSSPKNYFHYNHTRISKQEVINKLQP
jgi:deoxyribonuclease (pyrimidine dimer)